jgi:hypothetical protein
LVVKFVAVVRILDLFGEAFENAREVRTKQEPSAGAGEVAT